MTRAIPGPGIELGPIGRPSATAILGGRAAWAVAAIAAVSAAFGVALASDPGEIARNGAAMILVGGSGLAFGTYSARRAARGAMREERRRIARNLHDGLAQELAYIRMETRRLAATLPDGRVERVAVAAERALEESRGAIEELRASGTCAFSIELAELASELASRDGAQVSFQVDPDVKVERTDREALLRIMREAISNGVRHGNATRVALELTGGEGIRMAVRDNGTGFAAAGTTRPGGFGLTSMRERARALGGEVNIQSAPGEGTLVEVTLP